ncbi:MAG: ATPase [Methanotrichaceae archaeon]|nr:ATPase [Methanotrichaceae archaeon]
MAQRGIREFDAKRMLARSLPHYLDDLAYKGEVVLVGPDTDVEEVVALNSWLLRKRLVIKPDQLFGKRGIHGLILLDADWDAVKEYLAKNMGREVEIGGVIGNLTHFLIEPFVPHENEYYVAIRSEYSSDAIYFSTEGGVSVEENWDRVLQAQADIISGIDSGAISAIVPADLGEERQKVIEFISALYLFYVDCGFVYLEINPFTITDGTIMPLDMVAKLDDAEEFWCRERWLDLSFPEPFGRTPTPEESYIKDLDSKTGSSLKLTILNPAGRVWTMIAGGGASVIYADTICDLGHSCDLANYGEYSGDPNTEETYHYTATILDLMTRERDPRGRILLIGGAIANFTDVASTFKGIVMALREYRDRLKESDVKIYVRRGGPNYEQGLKLMRSLGRELDIPIEVFGPEMHMTRIVPMALGE